MPDRASPLPARPSAVFLWDAAVFRVVYHATPPSEGPPPGVSSIPEDGGPGTYWFVPDLTATIAGPDPVAPQAPPSA